MWKERKVVEGNAVEKERGEDDKDGCKEGEEGWDREAKDVTLIAADVDTETENDIDVGADRWDKQANKEEEGEEGAREGKREERRRIKLVSIVSTAYNVLKYKSN